MDPKIVLEHIIRRLQPEVGDIKNTDYSFWEDEARVPGWRLHLATALQTAEEALASGNHDEIIAAALTCPAHERTGRSLQTKQMRIERQRKGGAMRGATQTTHQLSVWAPYIEQYNALLSKGQTQAKARQLMKHRMTTDFASEQFRPGPTFPTDRTIRKWLK